MTYTLRKKNIFSNKISAKNINKYLNNKQLIERVSEKM